MKTPEDAITEGFVNPWARLILLFFGSYIMAIFYPAPESVYHLLVGPRVEGNVIYSHTPRWIDHRVLPVFGVFFSDTVFLSGPIAVACILCSALDRWRVWKTTILCGVSTFLVFSLESWTSDMSALALNAMYGCLMVLPVVLILRKT